jgi:putative ABC transport system permease protein
MRRALRALAARPGFTVVIIATLALGFGVNAAVFSLTRTVLLRPLPYRDRDRLVQVDEMNRTRGAAPGGVVPANYVLWRTRATSFDLTAAWRFVYFSLSGEIGPMHVQGGLVEPTFFKVLGVIPSLGRDFADDEGLTNQGNVVLLTNGFWQRQFGGRADVIGRRLVVDGTACTIVGVLPPTFKFFHVLNRDLDIWRPFTVDPADREHSVSVYARLRAGATVDDSRAEMSTVFSSLPAASFRDGWTPDVSLLSARFTRGPRPILATLQAAVALVMCIAAANIANLLLAVAAGRRKETAVRVALGATRVQLIADLGHETLLLAGAGAAAGALLAIWIVELLNGSVSYQNINRLEPFRVDSTVLLFTLGLAVASAVVFAVLPAGRAAGTDVVDALKDSSYGTTGGTPQRRLRRTLIAAELALAIVLVTAAIEMTRSALALNSMDRGVDESRVMTAQLALNASQYEDTQRLTAFADTVLDRLATAPAVESASLVNYPPLYIVGTGGPVAIQGQPAAPGAEPIAQFWVVAPGYFSTVGVRLLSGRDFNPMDTRDAPGVAIVSRRFAGRFWPRTSAIGEHLTPLLPQSDAFWIPRTVRRPLTIVGVVDDVREDGIPGHPDDRQPQFYLPFSQNPTRIFTLVAHTRGKPEDLAGAIREAVREADPDQPTFDERSLITIRQETFARSRELAWLIGAFAVLALALAAIGVYGVMACLSAARSREIGIRMALGAGGGDVIRLIVGDAVRLAGVGAAIGLAVTPFAMAVASASVLGGGTWSVVTLGGVAVCLVVVAAAAAAVPARRAARGAAISFR